VTVSIQGVEELVGSVPLLARLDPETLALVAGCSSMCRFATDQLLAREGAPADRFYALREGRVALEVAAPTRTVTIETLGPGEVCGWSWLFAPHRWQFDVRALEPVRALAFDAACLRGKIERDDALGYALMRRFAPVMLERLQATRLRLVDVYRNSAS
jgi:CRP/FNR family transcriptional regulator, cyclic AMP receptor protein